MHRLREFAVGTYLSLDPRSLGLFRVVFGAVLLFDLARHWQVIDVWYVDSGLLPGAAVLENTPSQRALSFFFLATTRGEVMLGMGVCALAYLALTVGYRTKWAQLLSLVCLVSLNGRVALLENGGDTILNLLAMWTAFLPLGRRFSLDALLRSLRERTEHTAAELEDRAALAPSTQPVVSLAVLALLLQFACIYAFAAVQKSGDTWMEGTAVHYALHQNRLVTAFGAWLRDSVPLPGLELLTWGTLVLEFAGPVLLLTPLWTRHARLLAIALLPAMHLGFGLSLDIGSFSWAMMSFFALLPAKEHWDRATAFFRGRGHHLTSFFDADCGICFLTARVCSRLDGFQRLRFVPNDDVAQLPEGITPEVTEVTMVLRDETTGRVLTDSAGIAAVLDALPLGFLFAAPMRLPGLRAVADRLYGVLSRNRKRVSVWLGLAACGVPQAALPGHNVTPAAPGRSSRTLVFARELAVTVMLVAAAGQLVHDNFAVPRELRYQQHAVLQALVDYLRLYQGWRMFTPDAPPEEFAIRVDAVTADGRTVDPYNEVASQVASGGWPQERDAIPRRLGQNPFFSSYSLQCARQDLGPYYPALVRWILAYPERTGNPDDRIQRFEVVKLTHISPAPGRSRPTNLRHKVLLRYPEVDTVPRTAANDAMADAVNATP